MPLAAVLFSLRQEPLYQSSADVLLVRESLASELTGIDDSSAFYDPDRWAQTQAELARTPIVARRTVERANVAGRTPDLLLAYSSVTSVPGSDILTFTVSDPEQSAASRLASAYAREYTRYRTERDTGAVKEARAGVTARIQTLERAGDRRSPLYQSLVEKEQQLRTIEALQTSTVSVIRPAGAAWQVQPKTVRNGILGVLLGLVLGIGLAFLRDALDTRVRSADEIERLGLPLLARIPEPPRRMRSQNRLVMLTEPGGVHAEAFRMLKTNLEFMTLDRDVRTVMVTSALEGEGKSTTAANLAAALARGGRRVVLVDLDLRRPMLHRFFRPHGRPGLTQVALGHAKIEDALVPVALAPVGGPNGRATADAGNGKIAAENDGWLVVLTAGPQPPDVGEFIGTSALAEVLQRLRTAADIVIVDAPPLLHVDDARVLSARVDGMVVVARLNVLRRPMVKELGRILQSSPAAKLGFVLAGAEREDGYGASGYYYRSYGEREREPETVA